MNRITCGYVTLAIALTFASASVLACGEGAFNAGKGLAYQGYLAPRPATVLVYADPDPTVSHADRDALYAGLTKAGHKLTVVKDAGELASALRERHYDVVITAFDAVDTVQAATADVGNAAGKTALLPVVARSDSDSPQLRGHFDAYLVDGAGLGQYLKMIGKALPANAL
jgi:hypothetical protein